MKTHPLNPQRLRQIPQHFSWVDHRLVRQGHLQRCDHAALSLYLFYLTVADALGMSYYSDPRLRSSLSMTQVQLNTARQRLITQGMIAYARPFVQVLSLDEPTLTDDSRKPQTPQLNQPPVLIASITHPKKRKKYLKALRAQLGGQHD
jgi:hypothetical protein